MPEKKGILRRLGPGFITAAVVLGPGSILAASRAGAQAGYQLVWILILSGILMACFTAMGARLGCALSCTPLQYIANRWGRWLAMITGLSAFLVCAGYQFGNNLGVAVALSNLVGGPPWIWPLVFTALSLVFLFCAKQLYQWLEKGMMILVGFMIIAFSANLLFTGISPLGLAKGLIPRSFAPGEGLIAMAMIGTTFSAVAAFYQPYLVRAKGWGKEDLGNAIGDAWVGIAVLGGIGFVIMAGAAEGLHGSGEDFTNVGALAQQLRSVLGPAATTVFCFGLAAAAFSSFIANALIGGTLMADGLGQDAEVGGSPSRKWTAAVMLIGCVVAVATLQYQKGSTTSVLIAQTSTLVAAPLCAIWIYYLSSSQKVMETLKNRGVALCVGAAGLGVLLFLNLRLLLTLFQRLLSLLQRLGIG
jgi:manganese transport protein